MKTIRFVSFLLLAAVSVNAPAQDAAGEVVLITGAASAAGTTGTRLLRKGDTLFVGDTVMVGANSYVNLKFADGGRVLLRPNTDFTVEAFKFAPDAAAPTAGPGKAAPSQQQAFFRLLRGGFRALSGLIGKGNAQDYRVSTPVATIGIRGTDYEVQLCNQDCPETPAQAASGGVEVAATRLDGLELAQAGTIGGDAPPLPGGLLLATNEGTVVMKTGRGEYLIKVGEVAFALSNGQVMMLPAVPDALLVNPAPSPEECQ